MTVLPRLRCLQKLRARSSSCLRYPHAGDGWDALALAAARDHPSLAILLMTGYADQRERASGLEVLIRDVITKPFSLATIRGVVNDALAGCTRQIH